MVCKKCKNQIPDGSEFCSYCGHRAAKKKEEKGKSKTPFLIGLAIGLLVALILTVVLAAVLNRDKKNELEKEAVEGQAVDSKIDKKAENPLPKNEIDDEKGSSVQEEKKTEEQSPEKEADDTPSAEKTDSDSNADKEEAEDNTTQNKTDDTENNPVSEDKIDDMKKSPAPVNWGEKWLWEHSVPFVRSEDRDNWQEYEEAYLTVLSSGEGEVTFEFMHDEGGVHHPFYYPCTAEVTGNVAVGYTGIHKGDTVLGNAKIILTKGDNSVTVEVCNQADNSILFEGVMYSYNSTYKQLSCRAILDCFHESGETYYLYDVDADGSKELLVDSKWARGERRITIYKVTNSDAQAMGTFSPGNGKLCNNPDGKGFIVYYCENGQQWMNTVVYRNGVFVSEQLVAPVSVDSTVIKTPGELKSGVNYMTESAANDYALLKQ